MRVIIFVVVILCVPFIASAECRHDDFIPRIDRFVKDSYAINILVDELKNINGDGVCGYSFVDLLQCKMSNINSYCDTARVFFRASCGLNGKKKEDFESEYSTLIFVAFSGAKWAIKDMCAEARRRGDARLQEAVDQYSEMLDEFVDALYEAMSTL